MGILEITVKKCKCEKCEHDRITRNKDAPKVCQKFRKPYWNTPRKK